MPKKPTHVNLRDGHEIYVRGSAMWFRNEGFHFQIAEIIFGAGGSIERVRPILQEPEGIAEETLVEILNREGIRFEIL